MAEKIDDSVVVFSLDDLRIALKISSVIRVVRAVEVLPLAGAPPGVRGVVNVQGKVVPVFDLREQLGIPKRSVSSNDHLLIANAESQTVALMVDTVEEIVSPDEAEVTPASEILPDLKSVPGVMRLNNNLVLLFDLKRFLSIDDQKALQSALNS